ncbi:unnamed protein product [Schistocephalus solidus]|uniref:C2H2-type domain-containing protein n=1 Tax=Schistocephalus solidus TaxID=70667 RepID=A0A183SY77_SCHSO|nr:unnamed protein product [Schistocephalus solidus]
MSLNPTEGDKRPARRKTATNIGLTELSTLHRSLKTPSSLTLRPGTSWRCNSPHTPSHRLPPPTPYLPPHAPPQPDRYAAPPEPLKFPIIPCKPAVRNRRPKPARVRGRSRLEPKSIIPLRADVQTETDLLLGQPAFICRLCGLSCPSGDILHAHILLLKHSKAKEVLETGETGDKKPTAKGTRLFCRRCGAFWNTADKDDVKCHTHPCILQKAAYFKNFLAPESKISQGLPFVCLLCCAEREGNSVASRRHPPPGRRGPRRSNKKRPLRPHHTAARFASKLHLAVHIMYFHVPTRSHGHCSECPDFSYDFEKEELLEAERWTREVPKSPLCHPAPALVAKKQKPQCGATSASEIEEDAHSGPPSPSPSSCSILEREGLHALDRHIEQDHTPLYEYLAWQFTKHGLSDVAVHTSRSRTSWIYACPICQIQPFTLMSSVDPLRKEKLARPEYGMSGNAMLQTHIACFHAAGTNFLDWKLQVCQVCGEALADGGGMRGCETGELTSPPQRHLVRAGHLTRLKAFFSLAVRQGRLPEAGGWLQSVDWQKTCVLCWRKFGHGAEDHSRLGTLRAECRLQAHLISAHCVFGEERGEEKPTMACGWCGCMLLKEENRTGGWLLG